MSNILLVKGRKKKHGGGVFPCFMCVHINKKGSKNRTLTKCRSNLSFRATNLCLNVFRQNVSSLKIVPVYIYIPIRRPFSFQFVDSFHLTMCMTFGWNICYDFTFFLFLPTQISLGVWLHITK